VNLLKKEQIMKKKKGTELMEKKEILKKEKMELMNLEDQKKWTLIYKISKQKNYIKKRK
jgi:hypothetical protein